MDLIPLGESFYVESIKEFDNNSFVVYRNVIPEHSQYPICFCAANSQTWKEIFSINSIDDISKTIQSWYTTYLNAGYFYQIASPFSVIWACDQLKLYELVNQWNKTSDRLICLLDETTGHKRLDRHDIITIEKNLEEYKVKIKFGVYSDFHLPRLECYQNIVRDLIFY